MGELDGLSYTGIRNIIKHYIIGSEYNNFKSCKHDTHNTSYQQGILQISSDNQLKKAENYK
jgi:hypothetical protein